MFAPRLATLALSFASLTVLCANAEPIKVLDGTLSTTATLSSDYVFRGVSQNDENVTPMLNASWAHKSGAHVDLFAAPVNFRAANDDASLEIDATVGYTHAFSDKLTADASLVGYFYPGANGSSDYDYAEGVGTLTYDWDVVKTTGLIAYSPDFTGVGTDDAVYVEGSVSKDFTIQGYTFGTSAAYGRQTVDGGLDYNTWRAGVTYDLKGFIIGASYHDTNLGSGKCEDICSARAVISVAHTF